MNRPQSPLSAGLQPGFAGCGIQAGNHNEHYYYAGWRVIEERDNSASCVAQTVYGTEYIDAPVCRDRNTDVTAGGSPDDDCLDSGGSARYFYHQDANFRMVAMTDESAAVVERYNYDAYGEPRVYAGASGSAESGALRMASAIGNPYMHQGLRWDNETGLHENRYRSLHSRLGRFMQRDPAGYVSSLNAQEYLSSSPYFFSDVLGLDPSGHHYVPQSVTGKNAALISGEAQTILYNTTTGVVTDPAHGNATYGGVTHPAYNKAVQAEFELFAKEKGITKDRPMTANEAKEFLERIQRASPESVIGKFLAGVSAHEAKYAKTITGKVLKVTTVLKLVGGWFILVNIVQFADAASEHGVGYAIIESASPIPIEDIKAGQQWLIEQGRGVVADHVRRHPWNSRILRTNCKGLEDIINDAGIDNRRKKSDDE